MDIKWISVLLSFVFLFTCSGCAWVFGEKDEGTVIYGTDDRMDYYEIKNEAVLENCEAVASIWYDYQIYDNHDGTHTLSTRQFGKAYNLHHSEPFREQLIGAHCTGFLVAPNVIATAGHCINTYNLKKKVFIFGYKIENPGGGVEIVIDNDRMYWAKEVIAWELDQSGADYALVKLDRPVKGINPLSVSTNPVKVNDEVYVLGYPVGLPLKYAGHARVVKSWHPDYFTANVDTYGGNSGSPVFNGNNEVVGILVRGEPDFETRFDGTRVSATGKIGEACTRATVWVEYLRKIEE